MARVEEGIRRHVVEALRPMVRQTELGFEAPIITKHYGGVIGHPLDRPLGTVTGQDHHALTTAFLIKYYGTGSTQGVDGPLHTVTSKARFGLVQVYGEPYRIADATMRMLAPSELFAAQGFPRGYQMTGTKTQQISLAGNSVCPQVAEAIVRANVVENEQRRTA
jgi:DNA (cytosine-5)-methyltransferase 1